MAATPDDGVATLYGQTMGTRWRVVAVLSPGRALDPLHALVQRELDEVVAQMSTWEPASDLCRYNRAAAGTWVPLPDALFDVLDCACDVARASDGAFDPAVGALVALWGFGASTRGLQVPAAADIATVQAGPRWPDLRLQARPHAAWQPGGLSLDLSGIAKGHAVDRVADALRQARVDAALVDVGGELLGYGRKGDGSAWRVLVEATDDPDEATPPCVIQLDGMAAATSGDRWHGFEHGGVRYSHSVDPRSGWPVPAQVAAVTVLAPTAMCADAWATALTVMGAAEGLEFAMAHGMAARIVSRDGGAPVARTTAAFDACVLA